MKISKYNVFIEKEKKSVHVLISRNLSFYQFCLNFLNFMAINSENY